LSEAEIEGIKRRLPEKSESFGGTDNISDARIPLFWENLKSGGKISVIVSPENLNIFMSGDVSGYDFGAIYLLGAIPLNMFDRGENYEISKQHAGKQENLYPECDRRSSGTGGRFDAELCGWEKGHRREGHGNT
jgi:hypothetical protein